MRSVSRVSFVVRVGDGWVTLQAQSLTHTLAQLMVLLKHGGSEAEEQEMLDLVIIRIRAILESIN